MGAANSKKIEKSKSDRNDLINTMNEISSDLILNISDDEIINLINKQYCTDLVNLSAGLLKDLNLFNLVIINDHITDKKIFNAIDNMNIKLGKSPAKKIPPSPQAPQQASQQAPPQAPQQAPPQSIQEGGKIFEPENQSLVNKEHVDKDPLNQETVKQEPVKQEPVIQEPVNQEQIEKETVKQEPERQSIKLNMNDISEVLNKKTMEEHQTKHEICESIAVYYVKIAHIYAAIVKIIDFDKKGFCSKKHNEFFIENIVDKKYNKKVDKIKIKSNYCNTIKKSKKKFKKNINKPDFDNEIGIPELEKLYLNKYDTMLGKFVMDEENKKKYLEDVKTFYKIYTNKEWDGKTKKFSDIPIYEYKPISFCEKKKATAVLEGNKKNENIKDFANQLALIMNNSYNYDKKLIKILNELFVFNENGEKLRINLQLKKKDLDEKYEEVRNIIFNIYKNCEMDYQKTISLFQKIVLDSQIKISDEIINNDSSDYSNIPQNVELSSSAKKRLNRKKEAHKKEMEKHEDYINKKIKYMQKKKKEEEEEKQEKEEEYKKQIEIVMNDLINQNRENFSNYNEIEMIYYLIIFFYLIQNEVIKYLLNKDEFKKLLNEDEVNNLFNKNKVENLFNKNKVENFLKNDEGIKKLIKKNINNKKDISPEDNTWLENNDKNNFILNNNNSSEYINNNKDSIINEDNTWLENNDKYNFILNNNNSSEYIKNNKDSIINEVNKEISDWLNNHDDNIKNNSNKILNIPILDYKIKIKLILLALFKRNKDSKNKTETDVEKRIALRMGGKPDVQKHYIEIFVETLNWNGEETGSYDNYIDYLNFLFDYIFIDENS